MTHVFISYAHKDKPHLDRLVSWLQEADLSENDLWYDHHIDGGNNWREEIAVALDEAYVVLVIVTEHSVESMYCTYEWAYALGQGIQVLPLIFDRVDIVKVPPPLASRQFTDCKEQIPSNLKTQIEQLKSTPPQIAAINEAIYEAIDDMHRRFFVLQWLGDEVRSLDYEEAKELNKFFARKSIEARQKLQTLMIDRALIMHRKQHRYCWQLIDVLEKMSWVDEGFDHRIRFPFLDRFQSEWLPAFEYFESHMGRARRYREYIESAFERDLHDESNYQGAFAEILRVFPRFDASEVAVLLHNKKLDQ